jgi:hypothetical protein
MYIDQQTATLGRYDICSRRLAALRQHQPTAHPQTCAGERSCSHEVRRNLPWQPRPPRDNHRPIWRTARLRSLLVFAGTSRLSASGGRSPVTGVPARRHPRSPRRADPRPGSPPRPAASHGVKPAESERRIGIQSQTVWALAAAPLPPAAGILPPGQQRRSLSPPRQAFAAAAAMAVHSPSAEVSQRWRATR